MNLSELRLKRAELYDVMQRKHNDSIKEGMSASVAAQFSKMSDEFDVLTAEIRFKEINELVNRGGVESANFDHLEDIQPLRRASAVRTLGEAFGMLARGERQKIDSGLLTELGIKYGFSEMRTEYPSDNIVQTNLSNVFLELVKDDRFLNRIPTETVTAGYYKVPIVTRENAPASEGKANDAAASGTDTNFTSLTMQPRNQYVLNRFHKDLIRDGGTRAMDAIWQTSRTAVAKALVNNIFYGDVDNAGQFNGFDNITGSQVYDTSGGSIVDYSLVTRGAKALNDKFVDHSEILGIMSPDSYKKYSDLRELASSGMYLTPPDQISDITLLSNAQMKTDYSTNKTRMYMLRPKSALLALFGNFELELNERYADFDHAAAMIVLRTDFAMLDPEHLFIATNMPTG
jgi:hypothetical protein